MAKITDSISQQQEDSVLTKVVGTWFPIMAYMAQQMEVPAD